jgi:hypothetical protein
MVEWLGQDSLCVFPLILSFGEWNKRKPPAPSRIILGEQSRLPQASRRSSRTCSWAVLPSGTLEGSSGLLRPQASQNTNMVTVSAGNLFTVLSAGIMDSRVASRWLVRLSPDAATSFVESL